MSPTQNRLASETSPYLLQHAGNPVDWFPWSPEALELARKQQRPILLSIGYSSCHWCHVMERESFESEEIAALMNADFVNIKVDREERPDLDQLYQGAIQVLGRQGGWPLTMFLTPELKPFFGGTYFPPIPRHGLPSFPQVLQGIASAWKERRREVEDSARQMAEALGALENPSRSAGGLPETEQIFRVARAQLQRFDEENGGFGSRPKFPGSMNLALWLRLARESDGKEWIERVRFSLLKMLEGGIYDQLGGGFHRYSVDEFWLVPHFEKMLYDNGLLLDLMAELQRLSPNPSLLHGAQGTVEWLFREMRAPGGAFYSAQDADSEGEEGTFFVWDPAELEAVLGSDDARLVSALMGVTSWGNFEKGKSVLHFAKSFEEMGKSLGLDASEVEKRWEKARSLLLAAREKRPRPMRDDKILAGWNGLMIRGLAQAGEVFGQTEWIEAAVQASDFIAGQMWKEGRLQRVHIAGSARIPAFAEDYALLAEAELVLFETGAGWKHFKRSKQLVDQALELFSCPDGGGFFVAPSDGEDLVQRPRALWDNAVPSATSALCHALLRLYALSGEGRYADIAEQTLASLSGQALSQPFGFGHLLSAMLCASEGVGVLVLVGGESDPNRERLWEAALKYKKPSLMVLRLADNEGVPAALAALLPSGANQDAALYFCRQGSCSLPVKDAEEIEQLLGLK